MKQLEWTWTDKNSTVVAQTEVNMCLHESEMLQLDRKKMPDKDDKIRSDQLVYWLFGENKQHQNSSNHSNMYVMYVSEVQSKLYFNNTYTY